ncbi:protein prenyltransferase alpha subunit repeat-containing protein 1 [Centruroides vittatus]|uniref:protein prenyltransferase alpha subunit repeat-containing protein 1 n=1 Tax=Centruroides vittatus TaxID=120091 RepID=UPI00350FFC31
MEVNSLAERILSDINVAFKKVPAIDEFDILPISDVVQNKCPVIHINQKVALEGWCVKHVYLYAYSQMMQWKHSQQKLDTAVILSWTRAILLINPDVQTAWNIRKDLVFSGVQNIEEELKFSELVLSRKPKCLDVFSHRKLLLQRLREKQFLSIKTIKYEFEVCSRAAERYPNNYYAWSHRIWVIQELIVDKKNIAVEELKNTESWVCNHISDHSGFHYRQFLITTCLKETGNHQSSSLSKSQESTSENVQDKGSDKHGLVVTNETWLLLQQELVLNSDLIISYPGHEALWCHRRFVIHALCRRSHSVPNSVTPKCVVCVDGGRVKKTKLEFQTEFKFYVEEEDSFVKKCLLSINQKDWQHHLATRHLEWLRKVLSSSFPLS